MEILAPRVSAESSIIFKLYFFAIDFILFQSGIFPIKLGTRIAFVFFDIFFSILLASIWRVLISQSTKTGFKLLSIIEETAVPKFKQGVITSLPLLKFNTPKC